MSENEKQPNGPTNFRYRWYEKAKSVFFSGGSNKVITSPPVVGPGGPASTGAAEMKSALARKWVAWARASSGRPNVEDRRERSKRKIRVFEGELHALVDEVVRNGFHPVTAARLFLTIHAASNELRKVVRRTAIAYQKPAHRYLREDIEVVQTASDKADPQEQPRDPQEPAAEEPPEDDLATGDSEVDALGELLSLDDGNEENDSPFERFCKAADLDSWMNTAEQYASFLPCVWLRPQVIYELDPATGEEITDSGRLTFILYTPAEADVVTHPEDPTTAVAFYYWAEELDETGERMVPVCHFWTASEVSKFNERWDLLTNEPNPLGRLPVTPVRLDQAARGYYLDGNGDDLYEATLEVCGLKTIQNQRAKDSGLKQLAIEGDPEKIPADQVVGGNEPIYLGDEATATVLDLQPNLDQFTALTRERTRDAEHAHGVKPPEESASGVQSGYAKKLDAAEIIEESKRRRKYLATAEQDLYALTAKLLEQRPVKGLEGLDPAAEIVVDFAEPEFDEDPERQARIDALRLKMNVTSIVDVLKRENPDLSELELVKLAYRNKRINETLMTSDQTRLVDLLATRANVGASLGGGGGPPGEGGAPPSEDGGEFQGTVQ